MDVLYSVSEVRDYFAGLYPKSTLLRWLAQGRVKGMRLAGPRGRWAIPATEVAKLKPRAPGHLKDALTSLENPPA